VIKQKVTVKTLELATFLNIQVMVKIQICKYPSHFLYVYLMVVGILTYSGRSKNPDYLILP
jgi:hypothetical protein